MNIEKFMKSNTKSVEYNGFTIFYSNDPNYEWYAVVEDMDGNRKLVDVSSHNWEDFDDFLDIVLTEYKKV